MTREEATRQLESLLDHCESMTRKDCEALRMAIRAIEYRIAQSPHPDGDEHIEACANCGSGEYLTNWDGNRNDYCGQCGQKIDWREEDDDNAEEPDL